MAKHGKNNRSRHSAGTSGNGGAKSLIIVLALALVVLCVAFSVVGSGVLSGTTDANSAEGQSQEAAGAAEGQSQEAAGAAEGQNQEATGVAEGQASGSVSSAAEGQSVSSSTSASATEQAALSSKQIKKVKDQGKKVFTFNVAASLDASGENGSEESNNAVDNGSEAADSVAASSSGTVDTSKPALSSKEKKALKQVIAKVEGTGASLGFLLVDCETGKGVGYNINQKMYGASSFKGPYCVYVAQHYLETGKKTWSSTLPSGKENSQGFLDASGTTDIKTLMRATIVKSDNASFLALRYGLSREACGKWLKKMGLRSSIAGVAYESDYPTYSVKEGAMMWASVRDYLNSDSEYAQIIKKWMGKTTVSPIRDALDGIESVEVYNKAGWCYAKIADPCCCDNALVTVDGKQYLLCVMSTMSCTGEDSSMAKLSKVAKEVFACREALG